MLGITTLQAQKVEPLQARSTYHHHDVWHNNVLVLRAVGQVWLEEKVPVLQVGNGIVVIEGDVSFKPVLPAKGWESMGTIPRQSPLSQNGLHRPGLAAGGDQISARSLRAAGEAVWEQIETSHPSQG